MEDDFDWVDGNPRFRMSAFERRALLSRMKTLCGLEYVAPYWVAEVEQVFRPEGLIVTRAPEGARLCEWSVGNTRVLPGPSTRPIYLSALNRLNEDDSRDARPSFPACDPGTVIRLRVIHRDGSLVEPPDAELTLWGVSVHAF